MRVQWFQLNFTSDLVAILLEELSVTLCNICVMIYSFLAAGCELNLMGSGCEIILAARDFVSLVIVFCIKFQTRSTVSCDLRAAVVIFILSLTC